MLRKAVLMVFFISALAVSGASISQANLVDGMQSGTGSDLPAGVFPSVNPGGIGDALVYGYYNVRGNINLFNIVNTDTVNGQKVRVVFRNAKNGKAVLGLTVCLSRGDVWTAYLLDDGTQARLWSYDDDTLTSLAIPADGLPFTSETYSPFFVSDHANDTPVFADDTREGYFEVYGLITIPNYDKKIDVPVIKTTEDCRDLTAGGDVTVCGLPAIAYTLQSFLGGFSSFMQPAMFRLNLTGPSFSE